MLPKFNERKRDKTSDLIKNWAVDLSTALKIRNKNYLERPQKIKCMI